MFSESAFPQFISTLEEKLALPVPGVSAHKKMAPVYRQCPDVADMNGSMCTEAAVLALFYPDTDDMPELLLTRRPETMKQHRGQIAFPGGRREEGENLEQTALRETEEEVYISRSHIRVLGSLTPLFIPPSAFCVYPFVGCLDHTPNLDISSAEVAAAFGVPSSELLDPDSVRSHQRVFRKKTYEVPHFALAGDRVWGATAMMLAELIDVIRGD